MNAELIQELEDLLHNPGWLRLAAHFDREWGPARMEEHYEQAAAITNEQERAATILQIAQRKKAIRDVIGWPRERIAKLKAADAITSTRSATTMSRGGF